MRIPLSWLREFTELPEDATAESLMADLVRVGLEEEDVHRPTDELSGPIVVGKVLERTPEEHSNGKTVNWCKVQVVPDGETQTLEGEGIDPSGVQGVICGAHNFDVGDKVIVTLPGAVLPGNFQISARKTYGHISAGMIASARELGLGDEHDGIIVLGEWGLDPEPGTDVYELLNLTDEAAEINVTADRSYVLSIRGVAREYSHATGTPFTDPAADITAPEPNDSGYPVVLDDQAPLNGVDGCTRFVARRVNNVDISRPTPTWMAQRLRLAGIRSLSLPVDISNYVMLELGQPLHFYDAATLTGPIRVRRAETGETLETLDGKTRTLDPEDLLISDDSGALGLAGVMGGLATEVTDKTQDIVIESANFDQLSVARTKRRHKLPSEASRRNERGVDWEIADEAAERAAQLLVELAGGTADEGVTEVGQRPEPVVVRLPASYPSRRIGYEFSTEEIEKVLTDLGCTFETETDTEGETVYVITAPTWRVDLNIAEDFTEEIARLVGYDKIPVSLPVPPPGRGLTRSQRQRRTVTDAVAAAGLVETLSYPFVSEEQNKLFGAVNDKDAAAQRTVRLANPISAEFGWLRTSILPGLIGTAKRNISRGFRDLALYEEGLVFLPGDTLGSGEIPTVGIHPEPEVLSEIVGGIPHQPHRLAGIFVGNDTLPGPDASPRAWDWNDPISLVLDIAEALGADITVRQGAHHAFHPGRCAEFVAASGTEGADVVIGYAGELLPKMLETEDLPPRVQAFEIDLDRLGEIAVEVVSANPITVYPAVNQDLALVVDSDVTAARVAQVIRDAAGELLEDVALFDIYTGEGIDDGKKSLAFNLRFRAADRTLTNDEASEARLAAVEAATNTLGAQIR